MATVQSLEQVVQEQATTIANQGTQISTLEGYMARASDSSQQLAAAITEMRAQLTQVKAKQEVMGTVETVVEKLADKMNGRDTKKWKDVA